MNLISVPGIIRPSFGMSDEMTVAIFGYPPVVWQSAIRMIGNPLPGTWIAPRTMPSEAML